MRLLPETPRRQEILKFYVLLDGDMTGALKACGTQCPFRLARTKTDSAPPATEMEIDVVRTRQQSCVLPLAEFLRDAGRAILAKVLTHGALVLKTKWIVVEFD